MTIQEVIEIMESHHKNSDPAQPTCDGVIAGDVSKKCTGVALTCCPTARVIRQAADEGCNLLICHEPTFFDGWDKTDWLEGDQVYLAKKALLEETGMTVYRNHDHLHSDRPDGIFTGVAKKLGWEKFAQSDEFMPGCCFQLPPTTVAGAAEQLARAMGIDGIRIIGDPDMEVERAAVVFHFSDRNTGRLLVVYQAGLNITGLGFLLRGLTQVLGTERSRGIDASISGIAGVGHILVGVGIILLLLEIRKRA